MKTETGYAPVKGGELYYEVAGEGRPMVLLHAGLSTLRMWDDQWDVFTKQYRVVRYDTRGFGKSRTEAVEFSNRQDLRDVMKHVGMTKAVLVGGSRGGAIAIDFTLESPDMVEVLVLVGSALSGNLAFEMPDHEKPLWDEIEQAIISEDWDRLVQLDLQLGLAGPLRKKEDIDSSLWQRAWAIHRANYGRDEPQPSPISLEPPAAGRLGEISKPSLVIVGEYDSAFNLHNSNYIASAVASANKVVMPDTSHMPPMEHPDLFNKIVLDFLKST